MAKNAEANSRFSFKLKNKSVMLISKYFDTLINYNAAKSSRNLIRKAIEIRAVRIALESARPPWEKSDYA